MDLSSSSSSFPPRPASAHSRGAACHTSAMRESAEAVPRWEAPQRLAHRYARLRTSTSSSIRSTGLDRTDNEAPRSSVESLPSSVGCAPRYAHHRRPPPLSINRNTDHSDDDGYGSNASEFSCFPPRPIYYALQFHLLKHRLVSVGGSCPAAAVS
ncbi:hypothetical protein FOZ63_001126 [Perkinsus olseni]|uniref:Uncharacterized protein n=1 Tax=Perkinsus olseni TaxID=32597 RepID=A0A7J6QAJ1_PEROL|nr:hypothetical protein FOZ63_001126 [Perkinsus olseni]